jgi:hypothetical protein
MAVLPILKREKSNIDLSRTWNNCKATNSRAKENDMGLDSYGVIGGTINTCEQKSKYGYL